MAGRGVADGGASGTVRNPEYFCPSPVPENDDGRCHNYRIKDGQGNHLPTCRSHGSGTPQVKAMVARGTIAQLAEKQGIVLPDVKPKDFAKIAAEVISWNLAQFAALGTELEKLRLLHSPISHAREYNDIFSMLDQMGRTIATLTKAAAALPPIPDEPPVTPARAQIMEALEGIRQRMESADGPCGCCGQPMPAAGTVETPEGSEDGPVGPIAVVLPYRPSSASDGSVTVSPEGDLL